MCIFNHSVQDQKGSLTTNTCSCNLIGLPTFLPRTQKPGQSDQILCAPIIAIVAMCAEDRGWMGDEIMPDLVLNMSGIENLPYISVESH